MRFLRLAGGDSAGSAFPVASVIGAAISKPPGGRACDAGGTCGVPGLIAVTRSTSGSVQNIELIARGEADAGLVEADVAYEAFYGEGRFERTGAVDNLRALANLFPAAAHLVVRQDSGVATVADLRGRRISLGPADSSNRAHGMRVLAAFGLGNGDYFAEPDDLGSAADRLRDGKIDAMFVLAGYPVPAIQDLARSLPVDLLPLVGQPITALMRQSPFFDAAEVPVGTYPGVPSRRTVAIGMQLVIGADVPPALVEAVTAALWHPRNRHLFETGDADTHLIRVQTALDGVNIPLHQGAAAYYLKAGAFGRGDENNGTE